MSATYRPPEEFDVDAALDGYIIDRDQIFYEQQEEERRRHRCPPDMPPCPDCQARIEDEEKWELS